MSDRERRRRNRSRSTSRERSRRKHEEPKVSSRHHRDYDRDNRQYSHKRCHYSNDKLLHERRMSYEDSSNRKSDRESSRSRSRSRDDDPRYGRGAHLRKEGELSAKRDNEGLKSKFELKREKLKVGTDVSVQKTSPSPGPSATATKLVQDIEKRKLIFSKKTSEPTASSTSLWGGTKFSDDADGKMQAKFKRLMGMKDDPPAQESQKTLPGGKKHDEYLADLEKQYEVARVATHTQRGLGLGFSTRCDRFPS